MKKYLRFSKSVIESMRIWYQYTDVAILIFNFAIVASL